MVLVWLRQRFCLVTSRIFSLLSTHRVTRGALLAIGRPDGRLNALASAESTVCLAVNQASSIQNWGVTCEAITLGHNPFALPLAKGGALALPTVRPPFLCEVALEATHPSHAPHRLRPSFFGGLVS